MLALNLVENLTTIIIFKQMIKLFYCLCFLYCLLHIVVEKYDFTGHGLPYLDLTRLTHA